MADNAAKDPVIRRKFQLTDIHDNHNKEWMIEWWTDGFGRTTWGRTGETPQSANFHDVDQSWLFRKVAEKTGKGYVEVKLHKMTQTIAVTEVQADPAITQLVEWIFTEANENISKTLATTVEALSVEQITNARKLLVEFQNGVRPEWVSMEKYYNTIPTKLGRKLDVHELLVDFKPAEEEERLNQLEAALSTFKAQQSGNSQTQALGALIKKLNDQSDTYQQVLTYLKRTGQVGKVEGIYSVRIPSERDAFGLRAGHLGVVTQLWHGTHNPNVRHILKNGLRIPSINQVSNGSRFGRGVYFADQARRSQSYTGSRRGLPRMLFLCDVALGVPIKLPGDGGPNYRIPAGYDSVWGVQSYSKMDEFIIQNTNQQAIRFVITYFS